MATIITVDEAVRQRVLSKMKEHEGRIKAEVLKEAQKQSSLVRGVKSITFSRLELPTKTVLGFDLGALGIDDKNTDVVVFSQVYDNGSDVQDSTHLGHKKTITHAWHWELTAGVTFTYKTEAKLPELAAVSEGLEINFSATYGEAWSNSDTYEWDATINLQPRHRTVVNAVLKQVAGTVPFSCTLIVDGGVHCNALLDIKTFPDQTRPFKIPLQRLLNEGERTYKTTGTLIGASGLKAYVDKQVQPLSAEELKQIGNQIVRHEVSYDLLESVGSEFSLQPASAGPHN
jgi:hypothetical protein